MLHEPEDTVAMRRRGREQQPIPTVKFVPTSRQGTGVAANRISLARRVAREPALGVVACGAHRVESEGTGYELYCALTPSGVISRD